MTRSSRCGYGYGCYHARLVASAHAHAQQPHARDCYPSCHLDVPMCADSKTDLPQGWNYPQPCHRQKQPSGQGHSPPLPLHNRRSKREAEAEADPEAEAGMSQALLRHGSCRRPHHRLHRLHHLHYPLSSHPLHLYAGRIWGMIRHAYTCVGIHAVSWGEVGQVERTAVTCEEVKKVPHLER